MDNLEIMALLIPGLPLIGFLINGLFRNSLGKGTAGLIGCGTVLVSFILSLLLFFEVRGGQSIQTWYFNFINIETFKAGFEFKIDQLAAIFMLVITGVGFLIHLYSTSYMDSENDRNFAKYFSFLNLFIFSMLLLVMGANFLIMFIGWEGVGLCSYLLIGYWFKNRDFTKAANKAFIMNRIGDFGFLLALFWLIAKLGSLSFDTVFTADALAKLSTTDITGITLLLLLGATGKSAQIPLYTWLPDAMAGPTPVSALIHAATMVTGGIYMIARSNVLFSLAPLTQTIILIIGTATALMAATIAIQQNDIKKILAYSTVSQLGFMFIALGTGNYVAAVFHVITHAFFKALLFLGSGSVIHAMGGEQDIRKMGGLHKHMKVTSITFLIGCLAIAGIPGLSGFFSKDEILVSAFSVNKIAYILGAFTSMLTAFYIFRLYFLTFTGGFRGTQHQGDHLHESPWKMTIPLIVLAILSVVGGYIGLPAALGGNHQLAAFVKPAVPPVEHHLSHQTEYILMAIAALLAIAAIGYAWSRFRNYQTQGEPTGIFKAMENKWYVDELYEGAVVNPVNSLGGLLGDTVEPKLIDGSVNGVGKFINYGSRQIRWVQSGQVGAYVLLMVVGMLVLFAVQLFLK